MEGKNQRGGNDLEGSFQGNVVHDDNNLPCVSAPPSTPPSPDNRIAKVFGVRQR